MTLEEAIKHTEEVAKENEDSAKEYYRIANLEYHPNKKDAENSYIKCMECHKEHRQLAEWLRELKAYKESDWIPCSERLPEDEGSYLVTDYAGGMKTVQDDEFLHYEDGTPLWLYSQNVTAWRPLPEPYGGEQNDTD